MLQTLKEKLRHLLEILLTALLVGTQTILSAGAATTIMTIPLLPYMFYLASGNFNALETEVWAMFSLGSFFIGRVIALFGLIIFFVALSQWFWYHHKSVKLFKSGLYSKVRHPQFTGIIIITMGLTVMVLTNGVFDLVSPFNGITLNEEKVVGLWFLQVLGYITIARYEEWKLSRKFSDEYNEYKVKVPFLFPIKSPKKIPEIFFTIIIVAIICMILLVLPYNLIHSFSSKFFPNISFP